MFAIFVVGLSASRPYAVDDVPTEVTIVVRGVGVLGVGAWLWFNALSA